MDEVRKRWCARCKCNRPVSWFGVSLSGEGHVTCDRCLEARRRLRERDREREMTEGIRKCGTCKGWFPLAVFVGEKPGKLLCTCPKCRMKFRAWWAAKRGEPRLRHDRVQDQLSRAVCLTCTLPAEVCRGQLNAGCLMQYAPLAREGWQDGEDRTLRIPEMVCTRLESESLAVLPPAGFEVAGVARERGNDRAGETWLVLR